MNESLLRVERLTQRFGAVTAVDNVSLTVDRGSIKAIIGPNGAGKTTLFDLISGVLPAPAGSVYFDGHDVTAQPPFKLAKLGLVRTFQNVKIFESMSVIENVMVGRHARSHAETLAAILRLSWTRREERAIREFAGGVLERVALGHRANVDAGALSYGELKILELARALAAEPTLLLLDEPVAGVATREVHRIVELIAEINRDGITTLLVEHNMSVVMRLAHEVMVLSNGRQLAQGTPEEIRSTPAVIDAYFGEELDLAVGS